ncbi:hypothetical protein X276_07625 [Clostridium beijerinckii NRRL B-598]|nr:hypothetical protein X276_07625 [Clostridium beijerinckii NRRL B-598]
MDVLVFNKINGHANKINEIKNALKHTKTLPLYKRYSVYCKYLIFTLLTVLMHTLLYMDKQQILKLWLT